MTIQAAADLEHKFQIKFQGIYAMPYNEKFFINHGYSNSWWGDANRSIFKTDGVAEGQKLVETRRCEMRRDDRARYYEVFSRKASYVIIRAEWFGSHSSRGVYYYLYLRGFVRPGDNR
ncbi:MAG: hypothetical protein A2261_04240 [Candidatus Magasanikbacteria bacterium RIFOXYA2_FULL_44_8]|uniref:Uncharacterized protein n=1 Tax=Candidatus Magasanikbacteria bacterium RIFOXYA2_FULL_44_8 TaxID=1798696 RepID=A0A1F6NLB7_9BACT|nr:MAG: hypothetical protein A2261_04240 [Candidatus Magasanikbacteria bacterium RIFOXYA2_FULL_44_8]